MAIIKNIESKIKMATLLSVLSLSVSGIMVVGAYLLAYYQTSDARKTIYVLDKDTPILAKQTDQQVNREVEYRAHVDLFHSLFFTLTSDEKYIEYQMRKAMYLIDESGIQQYNNLKEKGFFSQIMSSSAVLTIETDSIQLDIPKRYFKFYGKQRIERRTSYVIRSLITEGYLQDVPRTPNNPHGIILQRWRTLENRDVYTQTKNVF
ncbi:conjugative transposon protein TraK [Sphingobacterium siyangense]|uniref:conjugative transposon protein TraK n=1 Tax=Sphingobacterium siyangense TaxID=459529 RepID=UPI00289B09C3|nr:conjugative transposon protein TraK [Sphingobacterium siyangense]